MTKCFKRRSKLRRCRSLTFGTAQGRGDSFVHDEQRSVEPRALQGHLYLLNAWVQSSLPGLLSGEDGIALAVDLSGRWTRSCCSGCKVWGRVDRLKVRWGMLMSYSHRGVGQKRNHYSHREDLEVRVYLYSCAEVLTQHREIGQELSEQRNT